MASFQQSTCACTRYISPSRVMFTTVRTMHRTSQQTVRRLRRKGTPGSTRSITNKAKTLDSQSAIESFSAKLRQYDWKDISVVPLTRFVNIVNDEITKGIPVYKRVKSSVENFKLKRSDAKTDFSKVNNEKPDSTHGPETISSVRAQPKETKQTEIITEAKEIENNETDHDLNKDPEVPIDPPGMDNSKDKPSTENKTVKRVVNTAPIASTKTLKLPQAIRQEQQTNLVNYAMGLIKSALPGETTDPKTDVKFVQRRKILAKRAMDQRTAVLVSNLRAAKMDDIKLTWLKQLAQHLEEYPAARMLAMKEKILPILLRLRNSHDDALREEALEVLALTGYVEPVSGRGIRVLSLDGGGTRGLVALEVMKALEAETGRPLHELFDYVCGVSTGSLIGIMLTVFRVPLDECEHIYKEFSKEMFARNKLMGVSKLFTSHAYYDTDLWENILRENIGRIPMIKTRRDHHCPRLSSVSAIVNVERVQNFLFRNYTFLPGANSHYIGETHNPMWQVIRASSAAPGYFEECKMDEYVHQDGGILTNNPTAIALHECRLLWPSTHIQCVVSVGTGRHIPTDEAVDPGLSSLKGKLTKIVQSATDTEAVHTTLMDLLPPSTYYRFNPYLSEDPQLDEIRPEKWEQMKHDANMYCRKNSHKLQMAAQQLNKEKLPHQKVTDWVKERVDMFV